MKKSDIYTLVFGVLLIGLWSLVSHYFSYDLLPSPSEVLRTTADVLVSDKFYENLLYSVRRVIIGFVLSFLMALLVGMAAGYSKVFRGVLDNVMYPWLLIPAIVFSFIFVILFGAKEITSILVLMAVVTPQMSLITIAGFTNLNDDYIQLAKAFKLHTGAYLKKVLIPQIKPSLIAAANYGLSMSWRMVLVAETFALNKGIGRQIYNYFGSFSIDMVLAYTISFIIAFTTLTYVLKMLYRSVLG